MGDWDLSANLICQEDVTHLNDYDEGDYEISMRSKDSFLSETDDDDDEYIEILVSKESSFQSHSQSPLESMEWLRCSRSIHIKWILRMKASFGLGVQTAYLAVTYFDRFLFRRTINEEKTWALRLLSISCLSLAAKMEECHPPALSELQIEGYHFDSTVIQRMELLVLNTLGWRLSYVTPFSFLRCFASRLGLLRKDSLPRAIGFVFAAVGVVNSGDHRPSVIAAAAVLAASNEMFTKELIESKICMISLSRPLEIDNVLSCYTAMILESQKEKLEAPNIVVSTNLSTNSRSAIDSVNVIGTTSTFTVSRFKRRRLHSPNNE